MEVRIPPKPTLTQVTKLQTLTVRADPRQLQFMCICLPGSGQRDALRRATAGGPKFQRGR